MELTGHAQALKNRIVWQPDQPTADWLGKQLWEVLFTRGWDRPLEGRLVVDSWAIQAAGDKGGVPVNGHAVAVMDGARTETPESQRLYDESFASPDRSVIVSFFAQPAVKSMPSTAP